jgi:hypothetical protein
MRIVEQAFHDNLPFEAHHLLVHGAARGVDSGVAQYAVDDWGMKTCVHPADWAAYGKSAGPIRNQSMLDHHPDIDLVLAFPADSSRGTWDMVERAVKARLPVRIYPLR